MSQYKPLLSRYFLFFLGILQGQIIMELKQENEIIKDIDKKMFVNNFLAKKRY